MNKQFTYVLNMDAEIGDIVSKINTIKASMQGLSKNDKLSGIETSFSRIEKALSRVQEAAKAPITSAATFGTLQKDVAAIQIKLEGLQKTIAHIKSLSDAEKIEFFPPELEKIVTGLTSALNGFSSSLEKAGQKTSSLAAAEKDLARAKKDLAGAQDRLAEAQIKVSDEQARIKTKREEIATIKEQIKVLKDYQTTQQVYEEAGAPKNKKFTDESGVTHSLPKAKEEAKKVASDLGIDLDSGTDEAIANLTSQLEAQEKVLRSCEAAERKYQTTLGGVTSSVTAKQAQVDKLTETYEKLNNEFEQNKAQKTQVAFNALRTQAEKLGVSLEDIPIEYTQEAFDQLKQKIQQTVDQSFSIFNEEVDKIENSLEEIGNTVQETGNKFQAAADEFQEGNEKFKDNSAILSRIKAFVGLQGGIEVARNAMRNAIATIKELDAVMTEMAVVTDLSVGDYWEQLPEHTAQANQLGIAIGEVYKAETLYYQQGLKTNEVVTMSTETLKMARIAGLSAEDATQKMTAALRGFNMELNETSAKNISDVYSELAAITAADVGQISNAMSKTASIASSAGMEFETTAAFLAQIIETTQESAETAGTAMKTVIARFQELKKDPAEIGEVDGEIVDANAIETALRSVGVSLRDTSGQFRELDDVFLELSSKWNSLDTNTQRYIATIAAGSRQQSRFIAMMSDYSRTQELVTAANNSAGASNEQFEKTLDSLESKLAKLKNAWDSFTMGIMDSEFLKVGVEILTGLLTAINKITEAFGPFDGAAKIGLLVAALYLGDKALSVFSKSLVETKSIFGALGKTGKIAITSLTTTIKKLPKELQKVNIGASVTSKKLKEAFSAKNKKAVENYTKALRQEKDTTNTLNKVKEELTRMESLGLGNSAEYTELLGQSNKADQEAVAAKIARVAAEGSFFAAMELNEEQQENYNQLVGAGVSAETAAILAKAGVTLASIQQEAQTEDLTEAEAAEKMVKDANTSSTWLQTIANWALILTQKLQSKNTGDLIKNLKSSIAGKFSEIVATWQQVGANIALQASFWPILVIGLIVIAIFAALAITILIVVSAVKEFIANSPEGKLKAAAEAAEQAEKKAEEMAEAYDELNNSLDELADKYDELEDLTQGTREWKQAVRELNKEVLALTEKYPELASLVTNQDGVLTIDLESEEVEAILNQYDSATAQAQNAAYAAKIKQIEAQKDKDYADLSLTTKGITGAYAQMLGEVNDVSEITMRVSEGLSTLGASELVRAEKKQLRSVIGSTDNAIVDEGIDNLFDSMGYSGPASKMLELRKEEQERVEQRSQDMVDDFAQALNQGLVERNQFGGWQATEGNEEALAELGLSSVELANFNHFLDSNVEELKAYGEVLEERTAQEKALYEAMALQTQQMVNMTNLTESERAQVSTAATEEYMKYFYQQQLDSIEGMGSEEYKRLAEEKAKELYGDTATVAKDGTVTYGTEDGQVKVTREQFEAQLAAAEASEEAAKSLETLPQAIDSVSKSLGKSGKAYEKIYDRSEGAALTQGDINTINNDLLANPEKLQEAWLGLSEAEQRAFGGYENYMNTIRESADIATASFENASNKLEAVGVSVEFNSKMTGEAAKGYAKNMQIVATATGQAGADSVQAALDSVSNSLSESEMMTFMQTINGMDWSNKENWEDLPETIEELGLAIPEEELNNFISTAIEAANAVDSIDLNSLTEKLQGVSNISKQIYTGDQGRTVDEETYQNIITSNPELKGQFQITTDGSYVYLGESMDNLANQLSQNSETLAENTLSMLNNRVDAAKILNSTEFQEKSINSTDEQKAYIKDFLQKAAEQGINVDELGVKGLTNQTDIDSITSKAVIQDIVDGLSQVSNAEVYNREASKKIVEQLSLAYQGREVGTNIADAQTLRQKTDLSIEEQTQQQAMVRTIQVQALEAGMSEEDVSQYVQANEKLKNATAEERTILEAEIKAFEDAIINSSNALYGWTNPFDELYRLNQDINAQIREREKLEREYEVLLERENVTGHQVVDNLKSQLAVYEKQANTQASIIESTSNEINKMLTEQAQFGQFVNINNETGQVEVDSAALEAANLTSEEGGAFEEYVTEIQSLVDQSYDAQSALWDIYDGVSEIEAQGEDDYYSLIDGVQEAITEQKQETIDKLENVNTSIEEANSSLVDSLSKTIEKNRQDRENKETESNIADKQARLAYLQSSSGGGNALEIAKLQQEISDDQEAYQDSLVDQAISSLEDANAEAAEQRSRQIALAQAQLDYWKEHESRNEAEKIVKESLSSDSTFTSTQAGQLLLEYNSKGKTQEEIDNLNQELNTQGASGKAFREITDSGETFDIKTGIVEMISNSNLKTGKTASFFSDSKNIAARADKTEDDSTPKDVEIISDEGLEETTKKYSKFSEMLRRFFMEVLPNLGEKAWEAFTKIFNIDNWKKILDFPSVIAEGISNVMNNMEETFEKAEAAIKQAFTVDTLKKGIMNIQNWIVGIFTSIGQKIEGFFRKILDDWGWVEDGIKQFFASVGAFFTTTLPGWIKDNLLPFFDPRTYAHYAGKFITWVGKILFTDLPALIEAKISYIFGGLKQIFITYPKEFVRTLGQQVVTLFSEIIPELFQKVKDFIAPIFTIDFWVGAAASLGTLVGNAIVAVVQGFYAAKDFLNTFIHETIPQVLAETDDIIREAFTNFGNSWNQMWENFGNSWNRFWTDLWLGLWDALTSIRNFGFSIQEAVWDALVQIREFGYGLQEDVGAIFAKIGEFFSPITETIDEIKTKIGEMWEKLKVGDFKGATEIFTDILASAKNAVNEMGKRFEYLGDLIKYYLELGFKKGANAAASAIENILNKLIRAFNKVVTAFTSALANTFDKIPGLKDDAANLRSFTGAPEISFGSFETMPSKPVPAFKTGGIADFTGPAWLDGTKARPEMVLNARDTENFIQLKDILADIMNNTGSITENDNSKGDSYFDISISVDEIGSDYDVELLANKIRSMLYDDAMYRNTNAVSLIR